MQHSSQLNMVVCASDPQVSKTQAASHETVALATDTTQIFNPEKNSGQPEIPLSLPPLAMHSARLLGRGQTMTITTVQSDKFDDTRQHGSASPRRCCPLHPAHTRGVKHPLDSGSCLPGKTHKSQITNRVLLG